MSHVVWLLSILSPSPSRAQDTVDFQQAMVAISGSDNSVSQSGNVQGDGSQSSNVQGDGSQSSNAQGTNNQNGNPQSSSGQGNNNEVGSTPSNNNDQWYNSPSPAIAVCPVNQGWPRLPGSCDSGTDPPIPPTVSKPPQCALGTVSCAVTGHPGFCCPSSDFCCIDSIHQAACCPIGSCCTGALDYGVNGPPGGITIVNNNNPSISISKARKLEASDTGIVGVTLVWILGMMR